MTFGENQKVRFKGWQGGRIMASDTARRPGQSSGLHWLGRALALILLVLAACTPIYSDHGYVPNDEDLSQIKVGTDTRDSVAAAIGRPSASGLLNDVGWYYVQSRWKTIGGREPQEIDRQVLAITFTPVGVVENIERFGLSKGQVVPLSRRVTTTNIKGRSALAQLFGSIGHLSAADILK